MDVLWVSLSDVLQVCQAVLLRVNPASGASHWNHLRQYRHLLRQWWPTHVRIPLARSTNHLQQCWQRRVLVLSYRLRVIPSPRSTHTNHLQQCWQRHVLVLSYRLRVIVQARSSHRDHLQQCWQKLAGTYRDRSRHWLDFSQPAPAERLVQLQPFTPRSTNSEPRKSFT